MTAPPERDPAQPAPARRFLTFRVDHRRYALPAADVAEVMPLPVIARLPLGPKSLMGLANLRGTVIPLVDPRVLLRRGTFAPTPTARAIVLNGAAPLALAVDAVEALLAIDASRIETRQGGLAAEPGEHLLGAFRLHDVQDDDAAVVRVLDLPALLALAFGERRRPARAPTAIAATPQTAAAETATVEHRLLISFDVAGQDYALPVDAIREIVPLPDAISVVPRAEAVLLGVSSWRDTLLPLLSLRALLGFPPAAARTGAEKVLVATVNGAQIGLVADRARALLRADASSIDPAPAMLAARSGGESKITAIFRADGGRRLISLLAPEHLFREDVMRRLGDQFTTPAGPEAEAARGETVQFVVFRLGAEEFGLPIAAVDEVARVPETLTRVPKMPKFLEGVINLRGDVLPVVDQRRRFDMPPFDGTGQRLIVVRAGGHRAGLIVDSVSEVFRAGAGAIEPPPDLSGPTAAEAVAPPPLVNGVINARDGARIILLLDPAELLTRDEQGVLDTLDLAASLPAQDLPTPDPPAQGLAAPDPPTRLDGAA